MDDLPREIEEEIFKRLADAPSIAQLQLVSRKFNSDQFLWRMLLAKSCPPYEPPTNCSLKTLKSFVKHLPMEEFAFAGGKDFEPAFAMASFGNCKLGTYRLVFDLEKSSDCKLYSGVVRCFGVSKNGFDLACVSGSRSLSLRTCQKQLGGHGRCVFQHTNPGIVSIRLDFDAICLKHIRLEGPFPRGNLVTVEPAWMDYDKRRHSYANVDAAAGSERDGTILFIGLSKWRYELGKTGPRLTLHYADEEGHENLQRSYDDTFVLTNLSSFEWIKTTCGSELVELARARGANLARTRDAKLMYGARINFRGWDGHRPMQSGRRVSVLPGKYVEGHTFPHFTWGGKATKSEFTGVFELLCFRRA